MIWDIETGKLVHELVGHKDRVQSGAFSPDGQRILTGSWDNTAIVWNARMGQPSDCSKDMRTASALSRLTLTVVGYFPCA